MKNCAQVLFPFTRLLPGQCALLRNVILICSGKYNIYCHYKSCQNHFKKSFHSMQMVYSNKVSIGVIIYIKISDNATYEYFL